MKVFSVIAVAMVLAMASQANALSCAQMNYIAFLGSGAGSESCSYDSYLDPDVRAEQMLVNGIFDWPPSPRCTVLPPQSQARPYYYQDPNYGEDQVPSDWPIAFNAQRREHFDDFGNLTVDYYTIARWKEGIFGGRLWVRGWAWPRVINDTEDYYNQGPFWSEYEGIREGDCDHGNCEAIIRSPIFEGSIVNQSTVIAMNLRRPISGGDPEIYYQSRCFKQGCASITDSGETTKAWELLAVPFLLMFLRNYRRFDIISITFLCFMFVGNIPQASARSSSPKLEVWHKNGQHEMLEHVPGLHIGSGKRNKKGGCDDLPAILVHTGVLTDEETGEEYVTTMSGRIRIEVDDENCNVVAGELEEPNLEYGMSLSEQMDEKQLVPEGGANSIFDRACHRTIRSYTSAYWRSLLMEEILHHHPEEGRNSPDWAGLTWALSLAKQSFEIEDNGLGPLVCYRFYGAVYALNDWGWMYSNKKWSSLRYYDTSGYGPRMGDDYGGSYRDGYGRVCVAHVKQGIRFVGDLKLPGMPAGFDHIVETWCSQGLQGFYKCMHFWDGTLPEQWYAVVFEAIQYPFFADFVYGGSVRWEPGCPIEWIRLPQFWQ